jgi:hypothetical protein
MCKRQGKDANIGLIVQEMARHITSARDSIEYVEERRLLTLDEIRQNNPTQDTDFPPTSLPAEGEISDVKDSPQGKYFYKILVSSSTEELDKYTKSKELFLKEQAIEKAKSRLTGFKEKYQSRYKEIQEEHKKRGAKTEILFSKLLKILALEEGINCNETVPFQNIEELKELKNIAQIETVTGQALGELSAPLVDSKDGAVFIFQLVEKNPPKVSEIAPSKLEYIKKILWHRAYRSRLISFLDHNNLKSDMNLDIKSEEVEEDRRREDFFE